MTISEEELGGSETAYFLKTIENAQRLATDARLMVEHDRAHSAVMLSIFALEELGKALITKWGVKNRANKRPYPTHVEKQSATFALLSAVEITNLNKGKFIKIMRREGGNFHKFGPLSSQFAYARSGFFDDVRMAVTYADEMPKMPFEEVGVEIHVSLATELLSWFNKAEQSFQNIAAMDLASTFFENDLGRL